MFLVKELIVKNFRSHANSTVHFDTGINLISGRNGAGKTSILDAILVALYGSRPTGLKKEQLVRDGTSGYSITLRFDLNGKEYVIERKSDGFTRLRGDVTVEGDAAVTAWVERNIGPSHVFTSAVYVRQGEIDEIIRDEDSREKVIRRVTRIEDFENAWKNMGKLIKEFERERDNYRIFIEKQEVYIATKEEKEKELREKKKELEKCLKERSKLEGDVKDLKNRLENLEKTAEKVRKLEMERQKLLQVKDLLKKEKSTLIESIDDLESRIKELEEEVKRCKEIESDAKRYIELEGIYTEYSRRLQEIDSEINNLKEEKKSLESELKVLNERVEKLRKLKKSLSGIETRIKDVKEKAEKWREVELKVKRREELFEKVKDFDFEKVFKSYELLQKARSEREKIQNISEKLAEKISELQARRDQILEDMKKVESAEGVCPICRRELSPEHKKRILNMYRNELKVLEGELSKLFDKRKKVLERRRKIEEVLKKEETILSRKKLVEEFLQLDEELRGLNLEELKNSYEEFERLNLEMERLRGLLEDLEGLEERLIELSEKLKDVDAILAEKEKIREELLENLGFESLDEVLKEMKSLREKYEEWQRIRNSESTLTAEKRRLENAKDKLREVENRIAEVEKSLVKISKELEEIGYDEELHKNLREQYLAKSNELSAINERIENLKDAIEGIKRDLERLNESIKQIDDYKIKIKIIDEIVIPELKRIREKFRTYKNMLAEAVFREVEDYASKIFEEITDGKYSGVRLKQVFERGKEKLKVFVIHNGKEKDISYLSGGELIALGLAFRLALSSFMIRGKIPILILDEPTPFLDEERRKKLVDITTNYLRRIPQVIIVSHDDELKDAADRVISVEYLGGTSKVYVEAE